MSQVPITGAASIDRIAIIGGGLIGSSIALALRRAGLGARVIIHDPDPRVRAQLDAGFSEQVGDSIAQAVEQAGLVFVACPVAAMPAVFDEIAAAAPAQCLVTDCGSTKTSVIAAAARTFGPASPRFIAGHPIAGAERSGPLAGRADLFDGKLWLLCPPAGPEAARLDELEAVIGRIGARVQTLSAVHHDAMFAEFSHWPHAVVFALCRAIAGGEHADQAARFSGAGLRDTTRIGASSASLWAGILIDNASAVLSSARRFRDSVAAIERAIETGDRPGLEALLEQGSRWRRTVD